MLASIAHDGSSVAVRPSPASVCQKKLRLLCLPESENGDSHGSNKGQGWLVRCSICAFVVGKLLKALSLSFDPSIRGHIRTITAHTILSHC